MGVRVDRGAACSGAATACVTPATLATLKHSFDDRERPTAIAVWTASFSVGAALGPVLAGLLVERGGLSIVFLANLPPLALCFWGSQRLVPSDLPRHDRPLDFRSAISCLIAAASLLFAILSGPIHGFVSLTVAVCAGVSLLFAALAVRFLRLTEHPLLELSLFAEPRFVRALLVIFLGYFAFSGASFVLAQYLQLARAKAPLHAGIMTLPLTTSMLVGTLLAPRLLLRVGAERGLLYGLSAAFTGACLLAYGSHTRNDWLLCLALIPFGSGCGGAFATATELILGSVSHLRAATAAATSESAFEFGGVLGIAVLSCVLGNSSASNAPLGDLVPYALALAGLAVLLAWLVAHRLARRGAQCAAASACTNL